MELRTNKGIKIIDLDNISNMILDRFKSEGGDIEKVTIGKIIDLVKNYITVDGKLKENFLNIILNITRDLIKEFPPVKESGLDKALTLIKDIKELSDNVEEPNNIDNSLSLSPEEAKVIDIKFSEEKEILLAPNTSLNLSEKISVSNDDVILPESITEISKKRRK